MSAISGIYLRFSEAGDVAAQCTCAYCRRTRAERGEPETPEGVYRDFGEVARLLQDQGLNTILASLPAEVVSPDGPVSDERCDAMARMLDTAHAHGLAVYPVCGWLAGKAARPEFRMVNADGETVEYSDPGKPEVREAFVSLIRTLAEGFDFDGVSLDGTRYAEMELTGDCCYCDTCRGRFRAQYGFDPMEVRFEGRDSRLREQSIQAGQHVWNRFRSENVTQVVRDIRTALREVRPGLQLSAYVWGGASRLVYQDFPQWLDEGLLDWINPSGYIYGDAAFKRRCADIAAQVGGRVPFCVTFGPHTTHGRVQDVDELRRQLAMAREVGPSGTVLFTHSPAELLDWLPRISDLLGAP